MLLLAPNTRPWKIPAIVDVPVQGTRRSLLAFKFPHGMQWCAARWSCLTLLAAFSGGNGPSNLLLNSVHHVARFNLYFNLMRSFGTALLIIMILDIIV